MEQPVRRHVRAEVGLEHGVRFSVRGRLYRDVRVLTLGAGGCSLAVEPDLARDLRNDYPLENLCIEHTQLPDHALQARVVYIAGNQPITVGLQFLGVQPELEVAIEAHVQTLLGGRRSFVAHDGGME